MNKQLKEKLIDKAKQIYDGENSGHDFPHISRVLNYCAKINQVEHGNYDIIFTSALFHDVHRVLSNNLHHFVPAEDSLVAVQKLLSEFNFDKDFLDKVLYIIKNHDNTQMSIQIMPKELQILQDADILDSLGEIGLKRSLKYCKNKRIPITNTKFSLDCEEYMPNVNPISTTHYVYRTMIPESKRLHTSVAKEIAKNKVAILENFVKTNLEKNNTINYECV